MVIGVLKQLDEGVRPLLDVRGHDIYEHPLLHLLHH
jgi:hypothetical protein